MERTNEMEVFKEIQGYPNYQISNLGRVWSKTSQRYLKGDKTKDGYHRVTMIAINGKAKHKDEDKNNNTVSNLEWCDIQYNNNYGTHQQRCIETKKKNGTFCKSVICVETGIIYESVAEATRKTGITHITDVCKGKRNIAGGFHWQYTK